MAKREYKIVLENNTEQKSQKTTAPTQGNEGTATKPKSEIKAAATVGVAYRTLTSVVDKIAQPQINTIALRTGYEEKQQDAQFVYRVARQGIDMLASIAMGFAVGNVPGALIGAVTSVGNMAYNYAVRQQEVAFQRANENNAIFLNQIRMGAGANREGKTR